jgi:hypothetical protein
MGALAADRQTLAVTQAAVAAEIHQALDIHSNFATEVALDDVVAVDRLADLQHLGVRQLVDAALGRDANPLADLLGKLGPDAMDVLKRNQNALLRRDIHTSYAGHFRLLEASSLDREAAIYLFFNEKIRNNLVRAMIAARTGLPFHRPESAVL